jgi:steroid delta-isomerase-like uncharacterized protein
MSSANVQVVRRWFDEVWGQKREETVRELLTDESVGHGEGGPMQGAEGFLTNFYRPFLAAFPDALVTIEDTIAEGDQVAVRWLATATHAGDGLGIPASGKKVSFRGITWIRLRDGKLMEGWDCWNQDGLIKSLQGDPPPGSRHGS